MPDNTVRISLVTPQGQPIGGTVDIELAPQAIPGVPAAPITLKNADPSKSIDITLPPHLAAGQFQLLIRSTSGAFQPIKQAVTVAAGGGANVKIVVDRPDPLVMLKGTLVFDNGLPATGVTTRAYHI